MNSQTENKNKVFALLFTLGFHALLLLLFIFIVFITPIPPFEIVPVPEIEIGLGFEGFGANAGGSGQNEPDLTTIPTATPTTSTTIVKDNAPNIITDNTEESVTIKSNPKNTSTTTSETVTPEIPKPSSELQKALDALKNKKAHNGKGEGNNNTGGSGTGTGKGVGDGNNSQEGNNPDGGSSGKGGYDLKGRVLLKKPARMTDTEEEGIVIVEIIVDETGKVTKATPGQRGSTTTSASLYAKARLAAFQAKFNPSPDGTSEQRGTYTFVFTLE